MNILIWLFTFLLVVDCLVLILLVLIQLPKKEAGMGQAFGGGATDALFGAGSGTALTKLTKYTAGIFFVVTLLISMLHGHQARARSGDLRNLLTTEDKLSVISPAAKTNAATTASTNTGLLNAPAPGALTTNLNNAPGAPK
jgi:preprotein translocase subunit SecG